MTYSKFQYCRNLRKEIDRLRCEINDREISSHKNYEKISLAKQTLQEASKDFLSIQQEIKEWLENSALAPAYKESCIDYYINGYTNKVNNMERALKEYLGEA